MVSRRNFFVTFWLSGSFMSRRMSCPKVSRSTLAARAVSISFVTSSAVGCFSAEV